MRCGLISLPNRSGSFSSLAGKQQGAILDEQGIWAQSAPMVASRDFQERSVHWLDESIESTSLMSHVAGDLRRMDGVTLQAICDRCPCLRFSSETVWRTCGREIAERQGDPSLG
jgi:hypothetical protein